MTFHIYLEPAEEGGFVVSCPALPGCHSQGESREEAISNIREAIQGWLEANEQEAPKSFPGAQVLEVAV